MEHGASLAKGPALVAGSVLVVFGLAALLKNNDFPSFSQQFPDGTAQGTNLLGIEVNGWTAFFSITAGALMLFGAAQHHLAKLMSTIVGLALLACAVIALIDGDDVLGLAATNNWTKAAFAIAGGVILLNALMPRRTRRREVATTAPATTAGTTRTDRDAEPLVAERDEAGQRRRRIFGRPGPRENDQPTYVDASRTTTRNVDDEPATTVAPGDRSAVRTDE